MARSRKPNRSRRYAKKLPFPERLPRLARRALDDEHVSAAIDAEIKMNELIDGVLSLDREDLLDAALGNARTEEEFLKMRKEIEDCVANSMRNEDHASRMVVISVVGTSEDPGNAFDISKDSVKALEEAVVMHGAISEEAEVSLLPHLFSIDQIPFDYIPAKALHSELYIMSQGGSMSENLAAKMEAPSLEEEEEGGIAIIHRFLIGVVVGDDVSLSEENNFLNFEGGFDEDGIPDLFSHVEDGDFDGSDMFDVIENFDADGWRKAAQNVLSDYFLDGSVIVGPLGEYFDECRKGIMSYQSISTVMLLMQSMDQNQLDPQKTEMVISPCGDGDQAVIVLMDTLTGSPVEALPWHLMEATNDGILEALATMQEITESIGIGSLRLHNEEEEGPLLALAS